MSDMTGQSSTGGYRPAGWYHAQGDPPQTQRYWDGNAWQGDPQPVNPTPRYIPPEPAPNPEPSVSGGYQTPAATASVQEPVSTEHSSDRDDLGVFSQSVDAYDAAAGSPGDAYDARVDPHGVGDTATPSATSPDIGGFVSTLFDTKFNSFITGRAISIVYILVIVAVALATLGFIISSFAAGGAATVFALVIGPLIGLFYLIMIRMTLEFFVNQFRQTELLESIAEKLDGSAD